MNALGTRGIKTNTRRGGVAEGLDKCRIEKPRERPQHKVGNQGKHEYIKDKPYMGEMYRETKHGTKKPADHM